MHQRIAEHKGRRNGAAAPTPASADAQPLADSRAAQAAARVAARYAKAPSYSQMLAEEARAAVRAAEVASRAALEAQAAAESVLAGLEAASSATRSWEPELVPVLAPAPVRAPKPDPIRVVAPAPAAPVQTAPQAPFELRWEDDMPVRESAPAISHTSSSANIAEQPPKSVWDDMPDALGPLESQGFEVVEGAQPIHANLIEFPRELVATRKLRPRLAEGRPADSHAQLSIFEVEPWAVSTEPEPAAAAVPEAGSAVYIGPEWSGIELDAEPEPEIAAPEPLIAPARSSQPESEAAALELAALNRRLLAGIVDFSLISASFLAAAWVAFGHAKAIPALKTMEVGSALALAGIGILYLAFFFILSKGTPGMKYAGLEIRTFAGELPTRTERSRRMAALLLSILPVGLGAIWALFDEHHLCWHDHLSNTYVRKR